MISEENKVSVCIPAYRAESFIERTLRCAQNQTYKNIEIIVSIDGSFDKTEEICRDYAFTDPRIKVAVQHEQLGWSQNTNAALSMAKSNYFFIYFHDDIIEDTYIERLYQALIDHPEAASSHCDLVNFGLISHTQPAHTYDGSTLHRLVDFLMTERGTTLRSLIRKKYVGEGLRFPVIYGDNHWSAYIFHIKLLLAGNSIAVNEPLYRRWQREGSLTRSNPWQSTITDFLQGQFEFSNICHALFHDFFHTSIDEEIAKQALIIFQRIFIRQMQIRLKNYEPIVDQLTWNPGWFDNVPIEQQTRTLLYKGENKLINLEKRFPRWRKWWRF